MPHHLTIPDSTYARLAAVAAARNLTVDELVQPVLETVAAPGALVPVVGEAWLAEITAWKQDAAARADRYPTGFQLDDSRDSIYGCDTGR